MWLVLLGYELVSSPVDYITRGRAVSACLFLSATGVVPIMLIYWCSRLAMQGRLVTLLKEQNVFWIGNAQTAFNIKLAQLRRYSIVTGSFPSIEQYLAHYASWASLNSSTLHTMLAGLSSTRAHIQHGSTVSLPSKLWWNQLNTESA